MTDEATRRRGRTSARQAQPAEGKEAGSPGGLGDIFFLKETSRYAVEGTWEPPTDLVETPEAVEVRMEIAGIRRQDISVDYKDRILVVRGRRDIMRGTGDEVVLQAEMRYGPFRRAFRLRGPLNEHTITANYTDGLLVIRVAKGGLDSGTRRIEVK